eukprot:scaffold11018_cov112-Isochrysis_galbana.AAC.2
MGLSGAAMAQAHPSRERSGFGYAWTRIGCSGDASHPPTLRYCRERRRSIFDGSCSHGVLETSTGGATYSHRLEST